jgi:hypothetical protein
LPKFAIFIRIILNLGPNFEKFIRIIEIPHRRLSGVLCSAAYFESPTELRPGTGPSTTMDGNETSFPASAVILGQILAIRANFGKK